LILLDRIVGFGVKMGIIQFDQKGMDLFNSKRKRQKDAEQKNTPDWLTRAIF
jgi:hypothetical protein